MVYPYIPGARISNIQAHPQSVFTTCCQEDFFAMAQSPSDTVHVFDTWVRGTKGLLHFDVMTTDEATALKLAKQHLTSLGEGAVPVTVKECQFCHTEPLVMFNSEQQRQFREQGGFIITLSA
jgi:hypothetical protein